MTIGTATEYRIPVEGSPTAHDYRGAPFTVEHVVWRTYLHGGRAWTIITAHGHEDNGADSNCSWNLSTDPLPEWMPQPPAAWHDLAAAIAAQATEDAS